MPLEIKEDMKVMRHNIHLTCMIVLIEVAGHEFHITQQGCTVGWCCKRKSHYRLHNFHTFLHCNQLKIKSPRCLVHNFKDNSTLFNLGHIFKALGHRF